jgi:periplasmic protein CpxP/Spy
MNKLSLRRTAIGALTAAAFAGLAAPALAQDRFADGGAHRHGWRNMDPEARADRMEYMVKRMFSSVKASEEQKTRAGTIVRRALDDLRPIQDRLREGRRAAIELLARPSIDRGAIEAQRVEQLKLTDAISKRTTRAFADLAEVLTPEQRAALAKRVSERFGGGRAR